MLNVAGHERSSVMERDPGPQVKDVALAFAITSPTVRQRGEEPAVGVELREPVEQKGDHLARRYVGGECRIE